MCQRANLLRVVNVTNKQTGYRDTQVDSVAGKVLFSKYDYKQTTSK